MKKIVMIGLGVMIMCLSSLAHAQLAYWNGTTGNWSSNNWIYAVPTAGDDAYVNNNGTVEITGVAEASRLNLGIGAGNAGSILHSSGSASFYELNMSDVSGGQSYYGLSGTGSISGPISNRPTVSMFDNSTFEQTGGSFSGQLKMYGDSTFTHTGGIFSSSTTQIFRGTFNVSNNSTINTGNFSVGFPSSTPSSINTGTFNHTNGTHNSTWFAVGSDGTYNLDGGSVNSTQNQTVYGVFNQAAGTTNSISGNQEIDGTFTQNGGDNDVGGYQTIDGGFIQTAGSNTVIGAQTIYSSGTFQSAGVNDVSGNQIIYGTFTQTGGSNTVSGSQHINNNGIFEQTNSSNTVNGNQFIGGNSTIEQINSSNTVTGDQSINSNGIRSLTNWSNYVSGNQTINGTFAQNGGTNDVGGSIELGLDVGSTGAYIISGGTLSASDLQVGYWGTGSFQIDDAASIISITDRLFFGFDSNFTAVAGSTINLDGSLENWNADPLDLLGFNNLTLITGDIQLVNNSTNLGGTEALYVKNLILDAGTTIYLNGMPLYYQNLIDNGGQIIQGPGGGTSTFEIAGQDIGNVVSGYSGNFSLDTLHVRNTTVVPEPISVILFVTGGAFLAGRRFLKKKS